MNVQTKKRGIFSSIDTISKAYQTDWMRLKYTTEEQK